MLKILQARLQWYVNREFPDVQTEFRKGRGTRGQIANIYWVMEKQESSKITSTSALLTMCRGPAPVDPGNSKRGRRWRGSGNNCLIKR